MTDEERREREERETRIAKSLNYSHRFPNGAGVARMPREPKDDGGAGKKVNGILARVLTEMLDVGDPYCFLSLNDLQTAAQNEDPEIPFTEIVARTTRVARKLRRPFCLECDDFSSEECREAGHPVHKAGLVLSISGEDERMVSGYLAINPDKGKICEAGKRLIRKHIETRAGLGNAFHSTAKSIEVLSGESSES